MSTEQQVSYYRRLPYTRQATLVTEEEGEQYYVARISEIPWINIDGSTREEALMRLDEIFDDCILTMIEQGDEIPRPTPWPMSTGYEPGPASLFPTPGDGHELTLTDFPGLGVSSGSPQAVTTV